MSETLSTIHAGAKEIWAARSSYFVSGFALSTWAPMIPFIKERLDIGADVLGGLIFCVGISALLTMSVVGTLNRYLGCRNMLRLAGAILMVDLLLLPVLPTALAYVPFLILFGIANGINDVCMNLNSLLVEKSSGKHITSSVNAFYSMGCLVAVGLFAFWLSLGLPLQLAAAINVAIILAIILYFYPHILPFHGSGEKKPLFTLPKGIVWVLGIMAFICYLSEGGIMDWSGVVLVAEKHVSPETAGLGYAFFCAAMLLLRLIGDRLVVKVGEKRTIIIGSLIGLLGFIGVNLAPTFPMALAFFVIIGIGLANNFPAEASLLARQDRMPLDQAVPAFTSLGYSGVLLGPAVLGFLAHHLGAAAIFDVLAFLLFVQVILAIVGIRKK